MFKPLYVSSRSITLEMTNNDIFYASTEYNVYVDDVLFRANIKTNVVSLFGLKPGHEYNIRIHDYSIQVKTAFESASLNVKDFGAVGDGKKDDTLAIQTAIHACPKNGRILIEKGIYHVCPLFMKNDITIELEKEAILLGDTDRSNYPILPGQIIHSNGTVFELSNWEGKPNPTFASIITGIKVKNVHLIGEGIIDCNAQNGDWWVDHKKMIGGAYRPKGVFLTNCENIHLQGLTIMNTPSWNLHPYFSQNIDFLDLKLISPKDSPNTDGCNPESCFRVNIIGVDFSVGDDCIAIKSGKFEMGMKYRVPSEKITIRNCHMAYGHGAVVLGSEMSGGIKDLEVRQCFFEKTDRGLRIKTRRGRGESAIIDGIVFENIRMDNVLTPFVMNMYYFCDEDGKTEYVWSKEIHPVDDRTPYLGSFTFKNIVCTNAHVAAGFFYGLPEMPIESISLENVEIKFGEETISGVPAMMSYLEPMSRSGLIFRNVNQVSINNLNIENYLGDPIIMENVKKFIEK